MPFAKSLADLPSPEDILSMSGLEFMTRMAAGEIMGPPIGESLGYSVHLVEDGRVVFRGAPSFSTTNPTGAVHGGWYGTLLDSAMACAVMTKVPKGSVYTTLEYKISILRPIPIGMMIECEGIVDHAGRRTGVAHGEIRGVEDGKLYATGTTTCIIMKMD
ncbi:MAG: PaaI family thioesterase [Aestuariivita sp.]|uniref:PaaI family thioesterase n=1 Tax=Aestuariivita sp. TaxID=1872407 RepID=UPI003BB013F8